MKTLFETEDNKIILPLLEMQKSHDQHDVEVYARFMRHLRHVPNSRPEIKVLSAIQFTADMLGYSDAQVARILVDMGLRVPRMALPADFLRFIDQSLGREDWVVGAASAAIKELKTHWDCIGEDKFIAFKGEYPLIAEETYV